MTDSHTNQDSTMQSKLRIGVFIERLAHQYHQNIWLGISEMAQTHDMHLLTFLYGPLRDGVTPQAALFDFIDPAIFDGVIIVKASEVDNDPERERPPWYHRLAQLPSVRVGLPFIYGSAVLAENYAGAQDLVEHLITEHSYRKIAFILGPEDHPDVFRRYDAYCDVLQAHDIPLQDNLVEYGRLERHSGRVAMQNLLDIHGTSLDAVFAGNDEMALGAIELLWERGLDVPSDIVVVGFDDIQEGAFISSPLTTVKQPLFAMGQTAVSLLRDQIAKKQTAKQVQLNSEFVLRQSCGCLSQAVVQAGLDTHKLPSLQVPDIPAMWKQRLQKAFVADVQTEGGTQFLQCLSALLRLKSREEFNADGWQNLLTQMRRQLAPDRETAVSSKRVETIWHQARVLVADSNFRSQIANNKSHTNQTLELSDAIQRITRSFDLKKLLQLLTQDLPLIGIHKAALFLYDQNQNIEPDKIPARAQLMLQFDAQEVSVINHGTFVEKAYITSEALLSLNHAENVVVQALYQQNKPLGYMLFFIEPIMDQAYQFELLQSQISNVLFGALLMRQIQEHAADLENEVAQRTAKLQHANLQLKQYAAELERSNRELEVVAYVSAHDLQEPLRKMRLFADRLSEWAEENVDKRGLDYLSRLQDSAARMQLLIDDLQEFSYVITNRHVIETVDLNEVVAYVERVLAPTIQETTASIHYEALPTIRADREQMYILFHNLLENCIKFRQPNTPPLIHVQSELVRGVSPSYRISIRDNGIGFDERLGDRVFTAFQQLHGRSQYKGSGIGLAICRRIVERHQGNIYVTSEAGKGSVFTVELPAS